MACGYERAVFRCRGMRGKSSQWGGMGFVWDGYRGCESGVAGAGCDFKHEGAGWGDFGLVWTQFGGFSKSPAESAAGW